MTAVATAPGARSLSARSTEARMFGLAAVLALAHALDDAFLLPGAGVPLTQHSLAAGIALLATVVAVTALRARC